MKEYSQLTRMGTEMAIASCPPTKSGVKFRFVEGYDAFLIGVPQVLRRPGLVEGLGTDGVTGRSAEELEEALPGITQRLAQESGKIVFLGNGISPVPAQIGERFSAGLVQVPPVVVDVFDYSDLRADLIDLLGALTEEGVDITEVPLFVPRLKNLLTLEKGIERGEIKAVNYVVGSGNPPVEIQHADLIVNCFGPSPTTISEQTSLLKPAGELWTINHRGFPEVIHRKK